MPSEIISFSIGSFPDMKKICYLSAEEFTNELINYIRFEKMDEFRNKFRRMDILLIDDIQFIAGKGEDSGRILPYLQLASTMQESKSLLRATSFPRIYPILKRGFALDSSGD